MPEPIKRTPDGQRPGEERPRMSETEDGDRKHGRISSASKADIVKQLLHQLSSACEELCEHNSALRTEISNLRDTNLGNEASQASGEDGESDDPNNTRWIHPDSTRSVLASLDGVACDDLDNSVETNIMAPQQQVATSRVSLTDAVISINAGGHPVTDAVGAAAVDQSAFDGTAAPPLIDIAEPSDWGERKTQSRERRRKTFQDKNCQQPSKHSVSPVWQQMAPRVSQPRLEAVEESAEADEPTTKVYSSTGCCKHFVSFPGSSWRLAWDAFGLLLIFIDMILIPLRSFDPPETIVTRTIEWISLLFWTANVPLSTTVGYVENGVTIMDPKKILVKYLTTWFVLDVLVLIPDWFLSVQSMSAEDSESSTGDAVKLLRIFRLTKCVRLLRVAKVKNIMRQFTDRIDSEYTGILINIIKMFFVLLLVNHFVASLWFAVGSLPGPRSWVRENHYDEMSWEEAYMVSFHWSLTQFTPASKVPVNPTNMFERAYAICVVIFALVGFAYILGSISSSIAQLRALAEDSDRQFYEVRRFLRQHEVSNALGARILRFLEHAYAKSRAVADGTNIRIFTLLSDSLRNELRVEIIMPLLKIHPLFLSLSLEFNPTFTRLASCLKRRSVAQAEVLFFEAEKATHMIFLDTGCIRYLTRKPKHLENTGDATELVERKQAWIAEPVMWLASWFHVGRATAAMNSDVLLIGPREFADIVGLSPAAFECVTTYAHHFLAWVNTMSDTFVSDIYPCDHYCGIFEKFIRSRDVLTAGSRTLSPAAYSQSVD